MDEAADAALAHDLEERVRAEDVGADERVGLGDRAVDVRLRGEVHDRVDTGGRALNSIASQMSPCTKV